VFTERVAMDAKKHAAEQRASIAKQLRANNRNALRGIVATLRELISKRQLNASTVSVASKQLIDLNSTYRYKVQAFPEIPDTAAWHAGVGDAPSNLAEALLWKLTRWKAYKNFVKKYADVDSKPTNQDVVLFAFGKHLRDRKIPIYDQHAIRALWALDVELTPNECAICKSVLFNMHEKWKASGSGKAAVNCYNLFVLRVKLLAEASKVSGNELDKQLLMPLGQAIKELTDSYADFVELCGLEAGCKMDLPR
jgi:hypothetical protein